MRPRVNNLPISASVPHRKMSDGPYHLYELSGASSLFESDFWEHHLPLDDPGKALSTVAAVVVHH